MKLTLTFIASLALSSCAMASPLDCQRLLWNDCSGQIDSASTGSTGTGKDGANNPGGPSGGPGGNGPGKDGKSNAGRGNGSEGNPDRDPGNSGAHNKGGD